MSLLRRIDRFADRHSLWRPDTRVVAAVSGGSDSVALLLLLRDLHDRGELILECAAHLNHQIRGDAADADEAFCRTLTSELGVDLETERIDVPTVAREQRLSLEVAARQARQAFLERVRASRGADRIATAHTADDQVETVLLRLARGAGTRGLGGISPRRDVWVRPCLESSHAELREELRQRGRSWCEDATNDDRSNPRNRLRHDVIPRLEQHFNRSLRDAISRYADIARSDDQALQQLADTASGRIVSADGGSTRLNAAALLALPEAIARRVVWMSIERMTGSSAGLDQVEAVLAAAKGERRSARICALTVEPSGAFVVLVRSGSASPPPGSFRFDLPIPGEVHLPTAGWTLQAEGPIRQLAREVGTGSPDCVRLDAAGVGAGFVVRSRQPGDWLRPLGLGGRKKVQDVLVDRKVARSERDRVPIVTDRNDRIVWVAGHVLDEEFRVSGDTNTVVILKLRRT